MFHQLSFNMSLENSVHILFHNFCHVLCRMYYVESWKRLLSNACMCNERKAILYMLYMKMSVCVKRSRIIFDTVFIVYRRQNGSYFFVSQIELLIVKVYTYIKILKFYFTMKSNNKPMRGVTLETSAGVVSKPSHQDSRWKNNSTLRHILLFHSF